MMLLCSQSVEFVNRIKTKIKLVIELMFIIHTNERVIHIEPLHKLRKTEVIEKRLFQFVLVSVFNFFG